MQPKNFPRRQRFLFTDVCFPVLSFIAIFWFAAATTFGAETQEIDINGGFEEIEPERGTYNRWWGGLHRITNEIKHSGDFALALPFPNHDPSILRKTNIAERRIDPSFFVPGSEVEFKASIFLKEVLETGERVVVSFQISDPEWNAIERIVFQADGGSIEEWQNFTETVPVPLDLDSSWYVQIGLSTVRNDYREEEKDAFFDDISVKIITP